MIGICVLSQMLAVKVSGQFSRLVVILGGIYSGWFTPTESAIIAIFYTLFVGIFIHRELSLKDIFKSLGNNYLAFRQGVINSVHSNGFWPNFGTVSNPCDRG